ncbi:hypothetical protein F511_12634 [Dorcoceras hygrometricum]|uniref:Uncharacterized protein n=1 Tax=Dorcoceras hygrometricum TaxID=472368 RepID=A0A2Z7CSQ9_9LAMI|nr:hypothetical protein F511_12634 [Dorcoceras hygrometricum]
MASSYYTNTLHVNFESVLAMDDPAALVDLFENASVRDGVVVSTVHGVTVEISEQLFAETFELPKMVTPGSKQAKGYAVQISLLLENIPNLELGESSEFPSSKILTEKTVHCYVVLNEKVGAEEVAADAPKVTRAPKKKAASKKRPAAVPVAEPVVKKKRTTKNKSVVEPSVEEQREATSAVPIDEYISAIEQPADVETIVEEFDEPEVEVTAEEIRPPSVDDVDNIIEQVLAETAHIEADEEDHGVGTSDVGDQPVGTADDSVPWFDLPYEVLIARDSERVAATRNDLLEFSAQAQETLYHITDQLSELIAYINRGGNDKKGEVSSSSPQPPPDDQNKGSGNTGGDNVRTTDIVDRFNGSMSREGQGRGRSGGNRSGYSKRRRYDSGGTFRRSFEDWLR